MANLEFTWFEHAVFVVFLCVVAVVLLCILLKDIKQYRGRKYVSVQGTLLSKRIETSTAQTLYKTTQTFETGVTEIRNSYVLLFRIAEKGSREMEFQVSKDMYDKVSEETEGILEYKGCELIGFAGVKNQGSRGAKFIALKE